MVSSRRPILGVDRTLSDCNINICNFIDYTKCNMSLCNHFTERICWFFREINISSKTSHLIQSASSVMSAARTSSTSCLISSITNYYFCMFTIFLSCDLPCAYGLRTYMVCVLNIFDWHSLSQNRHNVSDHSSHQYRYFPLCDI